MANLFNKAKGQTNTNEDRLQNAIKVAKYLNRKERKSNKKVK